MRRRPRPLLLALVGFLAVSCADRSHQVAGPAEVPLAPLITTGTVQDLFRDRYIVVFRNRAEDAALRADHLVWAAGGTIHFRYGHALNGFAATLPPAALEAIRRDPHVLFLEQDGMASVMGDDRSPVSWGLDRVDGRDLPLDGIYRWERDGSGVRAYVLDTGIRTTHTDFGGRASIGFDAVGDGRNGDDCHGHGTHVAGTLGGDRHGIARNVTLVAVRVLGCSGNGAWSQVIAGINWVAAHAVKPAVANLSVGGKFSPAVNEAVNNAVATGVTFTVAAGNGNSDACHGSPSGAASALTVGATNILDARAPYSNHGPCLDLFAPGSSITSAWHRDDAAIGTMSGTSMAAPHVAGVAALYLSAFPNATPREVETAITTNATPDRVTGAGSGSPNLLLYSLIAGGGTASFPSPAPLHIGAMTGTTVEIGKESWAAAIVVRVHDGGHRAIPGARVSARWTGADAGDGTCLTDRTGTCSISTTSIDPRRPAVTFTITGVSREGYRHAAVQNHDAGGGSDGTVMVVPRF